MGEMSEEGGWERTDFIICQHSYKLGYPNTSAHPQLQTFFEYLKDYIKRTEIQTCAH